MSDGPLNPAELLATLSACGVDFVLIGALAVGVHGEVRGTGDVDVMLPAGDVANKRALGKALTRLDAERIAVTHGGIELDEAYPVLMFRTRFGKLDILYRPAGSPPYAKIKQRALTRMIGGQRVRVAGKDDMIRMKLAAGRPDDLRDVASMTAAEHGEMRQVSLTMKLAREVDEDWARDVALGRVTLFDPHSRVWISDACLRIEARRSDLTDDQLRLWAKSLAERLHGSEVLAEPAADVQIVDG